MVFFLSKPKKKIYIPVDLVQKLSSQGMAENQIADELGSKGFDDKQINEALRIALKDRIGAPPRPGPVSGPRPIPQPIQRPPIGAPVRETPVPRNVARGPVPMGEPMPRRPAIPNPPMQAQRPKQELKFTFEEPKRAMGSIEPEVTLEEIIEGIIAEKWDQFEQRLSNFEERDLQLQEQIENLRSVIGDFREEIGKGESNLTGRFEEFGDSMSGIEGRIGSIEKIFKDFLPQLTEDIRMISDMAEKNK